MLILLDIDGVMVSGASWKRPEILEDGFFAFEPNAARALQKIISQTGATILLTSSHKTRYTRLQWMNIFKVRNINVSEIDFLPTDTLKMTRKEEIMAWFDTKSNDERFVIIDDDKSLNSLPPVIKERFVLTSSLAGLTDELATEAISILDGHGKLNRA